MASGRKFPHTYVIIFYLIVISAALTWIVPGGKFERVMVEVNGTQREVIADNSFRYIESQPQTWQIFSALFDGFVDKADIIVFILMIGGAFWIMNNSKSIDVGIMSFLKKARKLERVDFIRKLGVDNIIITLIMLLFSIFGATFGMSEETIAFVIIFVPLAISMGYDSIVGLNMCFVAAALGFAGALLNPFTIGIAQGLSHLPLFSGIEYRFFCWIVINLVGISFVLRYMHKIRKNPEKSPVYEEDAYWRARHEESSEEIAYYTPKSAWVAWIFLSAAFVYYAFILPSTTLTVGNASVNWPVFPVLAGLFIVTGWVALRKSVHFFVLNLLMFTIFLLIAGVMGYNWYVMEIATLFMALGLFSGISMNYSPNTITRLFIEGVKDITSAAMVVGLAGGIIIILNNGLVIDTLLHNISGAMADMGNIATVGTMYVMQTAINIFIPSGSAKAALTMPIMSQFSDLIGLSRQATVMAFQFGDGFTNMITPTSGVLIGALGVARIPYNKWLKWVTPFMIILVILGFLLLIPTVTMQLNGF
ncbi:MAG: YfcC family protein [Lentimicrobiaceae bacterium]|nr:YfcC family protein [Lentimicrobiaceae bacterium]MCB9023671.1 YfcC family protein [Lentimicrobiaceae bacterium]